MGDRWRVYGETLDLTADPKESHVAWTFEERPGGWVMATTVLTDGTIQRRRLIGSQNRLRLSASLGGVLYTGDLQKAQRGSVDAASDADLVAQFPGKVRKILVALGDQVQKGQPLLLVEAMKMEFAIKAPRDGVVQKIGVAELEQVGPGKVFVELAAPIQAAKGKS